MESKGGRKRVLSLFDLWSAWFLQTWLRNEIRCAIMPRRYNILPFLPVRPRPTIGGLYLKNMISYGLYTDSTELLAGQMAMTPASYTRSPDRIESNTY